MGLVAMTEQAPDEFEQAIKRQILDAFGYASEAGLDAAIEEELPGYLAAEAEYGAELAAYTAALPGRVAEAQQAVTEFLRNQGMLPDGIELELAPMDLQADPQWTAQAPWPQQTTAAEPSDVLARIDAAIDDWESGPDAARWNPDALDEQPQSQYAGLLATLDGYYAPPVLMETRLAPFELPGFVEAFTASMRRAQEAARMLTGALGLKPCHLGAGPCFCHPKPFPAARDYRHRTKHRNRRRKS